MAIPELKVEIAWDSGFSTAEGSRTWTDVSAYVEGQVAIPVNYGRGDELSQADPNQASVTLDNADGRFTPGYASSPYYPNVKKGKPVRVSVRYDGVWYVRFTGYVNEWPVSWPQGTSAGSLVTITASSRRARLGQTAPLTSAIRAAYLGTSPTAYWPMDEEYGTIPEFPDRLFFRDVSNLVDNPNPKKREYITTFWTSAAMQPVIHDGSQGPTDETSLVRMPSTNNTALLQTFPHYVGGGSAFKVGTAGDFTVMVVARIAPVVSPDGTNAQVIFISSVDRSQTLTIWMVGGVAGIAAVAMEMQKRDSVTWALIDDQFYPSGFNVPDEYALATDGELHHFAATVSGGNTAKLYLDGTLLTTLTFASTTFDQPFVSIAFGGESLNANVWVGHGAVHNRALSAAEIQACSDAATAITETASERTVRVAGRVGVPSAEIDVETTIAATLGPQTEAGRSASEVLDEVATSTGGVLYDTREGHLALQARNHRYNEASAFSLSTSGQEIEADLTVVDDHRYTINTVEYTRSGEGDTASTLTDSDSIDEYGVFAQSYTVVSASDTEVEAFAMNILTRYADPNPRVTQVSVDVGDLSSSQRAFVLAADIGTKFTITGLPAQAPSSSMDLFLEGYTESISIDGHTLTMNTTPGDQDSPVFMLDDATYGVNIETSLVPF